MKVEELIEKCEKAINGPIPYAGANARITIMMKANPKTSGRRRLAGTKSPLGDVVAWGLGGMDTVMFNAQEVLDWLKSNQKG